MRDKDVAEFKVENKLIAVDHAHQQRVRDTELDQLYHPVAGEF